MAIEIKGTGKATMGRRISNHDLAAGIEFFVDTSDEWIRSHTGIGARYMVDENTRSSDLAAAAGIKALSMAEPGLSPEEAALTIDLIVVATVTPDYYGCPSTACVVQEKIGAKNAAAMDVTAGCTGFIYALETAAGLLAISPERKRALVTGAETLTKFTDWSDRASCVLFGDGAGAVVIEKTSDDRGLPVRGLIRSTLSADGSGAGHIVFAGKEKGGPIQIKINGQAVYNFAVKAVTDTILKLLFLEGINSDEVDIIIPHQANARIIGAAAKRLKIPEEKFFLNIGEYANTSAASIPIALDELNRQGRLKRGDLLMTIGFGGGLTFGGNLIRW